MPLATPPFVRIGLDPTWHPTAFDRAIRPEDVQRGPSELPREGLEVYRAAIVLSEDEPADVVQFVVCGPDVPIGERGTAIVVPAGRAFVTFRFDVAGQRILRQGDRPIVVADPPGVSYRSGLRLAVFSIGDDGQPFYDPDNGTAVVAFEAGEPVLYLPPAPSDEVPQ